jgi:drug/metabolite transporter (DMT)-like permease
MGVLAVSFGSIFIRLAQAQNIPSLLIAAARLGIASLVLTPFVLRRYRLQIVQFNRSGLLLAGVSGIFLALHFATWVSSLEYTSVLISVVIGDSFPLWAGIMEVVVPSRACIAASRSAAAPGRRDMIAVGGSQQSTSDSDRA